MAKILPCDTCKGGAWGPKTAKNPEGSPLVVGKLTEPTIYKCYRCKRSRKIDVVTFNRLPVVKEHEALNHL
jgi:hypothetical protein